MDLEKTDIIDRKAFEKALKEEERNQYLEKKGVNKIWLSLLIEIAYIFSVEIIFKILFGTLNFDWTILRIFLSSCFLSGLLVLFTNNLKPLPRRIILIVFNLLVAFYAWLQIGFVDFLGAFISLGNASQGTKITDYIGDFLMAYSLKTHSLYIPFIMTLFYLGFERIITKNGFAKKINFKSLKTYLVVIPYFLIFGGLFYLSLVLGFMQNKYQTITNRELFSYPSNPAITIKNFGTSVYFLLDIKGTLFGGDEPMHTATPVNIDVPKKDNTREIDDTAWKRVIDKETDKSLTTLNNYFINRPIAEKNEYTGLFEGKNLIMIMLESISTPIFDEKYQEYFPTLYKLYHEGITVVNNYSPRNNCATGESELTGQTSIYSIETTCTVNTYKNNYYPEALQSMMKNAGYYTSAYHDYTDQYYYRGTYEHNLGSLDYYSITGVGMGYNSLYKEWPSDHQYFQKAVPKFIDKEKFSSFMVTVTAHSPYNYSSEFGDKNLSLFDNLEGIDKSTKRFLSKVKEADLALEYLLGQLEEKGILDDTVIVFYGDHYPYSLGDKLYAKLVDYDIFENQEIDRTPFVIYNSATEPMTITKYTSPLDYVPTLLNLFGIEYDPRLYFGNDIFSEYDDYVVFPDNSWQGPYGFYSAAKGSFIPKEDVEEQITDEQIISINTNINDMRNMSALAIKKNYFDYRDGAIKKEVEAIEKEKEQVEETIEAEAD